MTARRAAPISLGVDDLTRPKAFFAKLGCRPAAELGPGVITLAQSYQTEADAVFEAALAAGAHPLKRTWNAFRGG